MWIARDKDGSLHFGKMEPVRGTDRWIWRCRRYVIDREAPMFAHIDWESGARPSMLSEAPGSCGRKRKVVMISEDGERTVYDSVTNAARAVGVCISEVSAMCSGRKYSFSRRKLDIKFKYYND